MLPKRNKFEKKYYYETLTINNMTLRDYLNKQIEKNKTDWDSKSALIRSAGEKVNGQTNRILNEYQDRFRFGKTDEIKNIAIKEFFDKQLKNSLISVVGAVKIINQNLPKKIQISETIIYNRLADKKFNQNNLRGQTLDNQVSKFNSYDVNINKELKEKIEALREEGIYLCIEKTQRGSKTIRLKISEIYYKKLDKSFPPNENSIKEIKEIINEYKK